MSDGPKSSGSIVPGSRYIKSDFSQSCYHVPPPKGRHRAVPENLSWRGCGGHLKLRPVLPRNRVPVGRSPRTLARPTLPWGHRKRSVWKRIFSARRRIVSIVERPRLWRNPTSMAIERPRRDRKAFDIRPFPTRNVRRWRRR